MGEHTQAKTLCAYCPKICRFSCPVSEATHNESHSAWGKMTQSHLLEKYNAAPTQETAQALHACTGCGKCTEFCKHNNAVRDALFEARSETLKNKTSPLGAQSTVETFRQSGNPFGKDLGKNVANFRAEYPVRYPFFPGCTSLVKRSELVEDALAVTHTFGVSMGVSSAAKYCCGYPLYAAGAHEAFVAHAKTVAAHLSELTELAVLDVGCAMTLKKLYPQFGVQLRPAIKTVVELLHSAMGHAPQKPPLKETVGYHDACHLGRGLGQYEQPRELLKMCVSAVAEAPSNRNEGGCSGGGGLLPRTMPTVAAEVARRQAEETPHVTMTTACPTSKRMFERAGHSAIDFVSLIRKWSES
jgi:dimethylglycine catabolism B